MRMKICFLTASILVTRLVTSAQATSTPIPINIDNPAPQNLQLPPGFSSVVVAEGVVGARHMAVNKQGGLYIKLSKLKDGKGIVYLKDTNGDGKFDQQLSFGDY